MASFQEFQAGQDAVPEAAAAPQPIKIANPIEARRRTAPAPPKLDSPANGGALATEGNKRIGINPGAHGTHGCYAWADEELETSDDSTKAWVYIFLKGVGALPKDATKLMSTDNSLDLVVTGLDGCDFGFHLDLHAGVESVKHKVKGDKVTLILKKIKPEKWERLTAKRATEQEANPWAGFGM